MTSFRKMLKRATDDYTRRRFLILCLAVLANILFYCASDYYYPGGAHTFLNVARAFANHTTTIFLIQREIGFPLLLWISGYPYTGSFTGIVAIHIVFATLMPWMVYGIIGRQFPKAAFYTAIATIVSATPFLFVKMIHHDQAYMFFTIAAAYALVLFVRDGHLRFVYWASVLACITGLIRPAGILICAIVIVYGLCVHPRRWRHLGACIVIVALILCANNAVRRHMMDLHPGEAEPSYTGQQIYYNLYINSREYGITLGPELGPYSLRVHQLLLERASPTPLQSDFVKRFIAHNAYSPRLKAQLFGFDSPEAFARQVWKYPNYEYFELITNIPEILMKEIKSFVQYESPHGSKLSVLHDG